MNISLIKLFWQSKNRPQNLSSGFTLIELIMVVVVIAILSAIALPQFLSQASRARQTEAESSLGAINRAQQVYRLENSEFGTTAQLLQSGNLSLDITGNFYQFTATPDGALPATIAKATAISDPSYTNDLNDYEAAIFQNNDGIVYSVMCRANDATTTPQANADPVAANTCVDSVEVR